MSAKMFLLLKNFLEKNIHHTSLLFYKKNFPNMKKILLTTALLLASANVFAAERNVVFAGYSFGEDNDYVYAGGATALNGNIEKDGVLLRVGGGYGRYNYATTAFSDGHVEGQVSSGDLMAGYQQNFSKGRVTVFGGANYDNYKLDKGDNGNRVTGGKVGAKGQIELTLRPVKNVLFENISNYTSAFNSYWSQTFLGYDCGKAAVGPEFVTLGNRSFRQQRFGAKVAHIDVASTDVSASVGYLRSMGYAAGDDGAYASIGFAKKF